MDDLSIIIPTVIALATLCLGAWRLSIAIADRRDRKSREDMERQAAVKGTQFSDSAKPATPVTQKHHVIDLSEIVIQGNIFGRQKEILKIVDWIIESKRVITLLGMGGIGKSVLACKVAERVKDQFEAVWGFSFKTDVTLQGFLVRIGKKLLGDGAQQMPQAELQAQVLNALQSGRRLLVLDNYETVLHAQEQDNAEANTLHDLLNRLGANTTLLITSREAPTHLAGETKYDIPALERDPAVAVIKDELSIKKEQYTQELLSEIAGKLSDHPLACRLIGGYLAESPLKPEEAVKQVRALLLKAKARTGEKNLLSFEDSLSFSMEVLTDPERKLIEAVSVFQGPFTAEAAAFVGGIYKEKEQDDKKEFDIHTDLARNILDRLCRRSLMQCRPVPRYPQVEIYSIHALIRETIQTGLDKKVKDDSLLHLGYYADSKSDFYFEKNGIVSTDWLVSVQEMLPDLVRGARRLGKDGLSTTHNLGILFQNQGQYLDALRLFEESMSLEDKNNRKGIAQSLHQIGTIHQQQGDYPAALEKYQQSLKIKQEIGDKAGIATSLHQIGMIHQDQGDYTAALEKYQQSLTIKQEIGDKAGIARALHQIGMINQDRGDYPAALEKYQQSLKIKQEIGDKAGIATSLHQIGMIHQDQGDYTAALEKYQQSLKIKQEIGNIAGVGLTLGQIGLLHEKEGDIPKAIEFTKQALEIFERIGAKPEIEIARSNLDRMMNDK